VLGLLVSSAIAHADAHEQPSSGSREHAASAWAKALDVTGSLGSRTTFTRSRTWGVLPTDDLPQLQQLLELNTQVRVSVRPRSYLYSDVSLVGNASGQYRAMDANGHEARLADRNSPQAQPVVSLNEVYVFHEFYPSLNLLLGKKRVTWGAGMAYNPTDLLNPRRDPTDPTFQRSGAWVAQVEVPLELMTFSLLFAPSVLKSVSGIPTALMTWPKWDQRDEALHYQAAARWYALIGDADFNAMLFYGNQSVDAFEEKLRVGLSFSRYFFTDYELHVEALVQQGSAREALVPECVTSQLAAMGCAVRGAAFTERRRLDERVLLPRVLVGARRQFSDDSLLSLEYLYQADGWGAAQFQDYANALGLLKEARLGGLPLSRVPAASALLGQGTGSDGLPVRVAFEARGQHYLFLTYQKPRVADDFTLSLVVLANLTDLSTLWTPSVAWSAAEWLTLSLYGFLPLGGPDSLAAAAPDGTHVSEYGITPFAARAMFEARAFF
jgi:hypothetical protein